MYVTTTLHTTLISMLKAYTTFVNEHDLTYHICLT